MVNSKPPIDPNKVSSTEPKAEPMFNAPLSMVMLSGSLVLCFLLYSLQSQDVKSQILFNYALFPERYFSTIGSYKGYDSWFDCVLTLATHGFLHADWGHVGMNAVFALAFGTGVVQAFGVWRTLLIYAVSQVCGGLFYLYWGHILNADSAFASIAIGASGAVSGLTGAVFFLMAKGRLLSKHFALLSSVFLLGNVMLAVVGPSLLGSDIAWQAHVGGYIAGAVLAFVFLRMLLNRNGNAVDLNK